MVEQVNVYIPRRPRRPLTKEEIQRRKRRRRKRKIIRAAILGCMIIIAAAILTGTFFLVRWAAGHFSEKRLQESISSKVITMEEDIPGLKREFLTINPYSRPGTRLNEVKNIFVHYTANPGTGAAQNRSYFENLGETRERSASAHFIIDYDGSMIQCIPLDEIAYAVITRNEDSISIECCYLDEDGRFTDETYSSLQNLLAWLLDTYHLKPEDVLRHYDEGGKECPKYYVEHPEQWEKLIQDLKNKIN